MIWLPRRLQSKSCELLCSSERARFRVGLFALFFLGSSIFHRDFCSITDLRYVYANIRFVLTARQTYPRISVSIFLENNRNSFFCICCFCFLQDIVRQDQLISTNLQFFRFLIQNIPSIRFPLHVRMPEVMVAAVALDITGFLPESIARSPFDSCHLVCFDGFIRSAPRQERGQ